MAKAVRDGPGRPFLPRDIIFASVAQTSREGTAHYLETNANEPKTTVIERVARAFGISFTDFVEPSQSPVLSIVRLHRGARPGGAPVNAIH
jgi:hypothetical protein